MLELPADRTRPPSGVTGGWCPGSPITPAETERRYAEWVARHDTIGAADRAAIRDCIGALADPPHFVIVAPAGDAGSLESLRQQDYPHWRLAPTPGAAADAYAAALAAEDGYLVYLPPGDRLAAAALFELAAAAIEGDGPALLFGDADRLGPCGTRRDPQFRTEWDPDLMLGRNAVGPSFALRTDTARRCGGLPAAPGFEAALHALLLRVAAAVPPRDLVHVPSILVHRRDPDRADAGADPSMIRRQLAATGCGAAAVEAVAATPGWTRVRWPLPDPPPLASIIVPTRNGGAVLARCIDGLLTRTGPAPLELILVDNGSDDPDTLAALRQAAADPRVRVLAWPHPFNYSAINNAAVAHARGDVLVFLNDDTDVLNRGWLDEMVAHCLRPGIGAVGAKLLYGDGRVQHCGMVFGPDMNFAHQYRLAGGDDPGPHGELSLVRSVLAVTGACLAMRQAVFVEAGGFEATAFSVTFNDADLCMRLGDLGYRNVVTPFARLYHLESHTRGPDDTPEKNAATRREQARFMRLWRSVIEHDPYHNPNLLFTWEGMALADPPRRVRAWRRPDPPSSGRTPIRWAGPAPDPQAAMRMRAASRAAEARAEAARVRRDLDTTFADATAMHRRATATATAAEAEHRRAIAADAAAQAERGRAEALQAELAAARDALAGLQRAHDGVIGSTSWRITRPLRRLLTMARALPWPRGGPDRPG